MEFKQLETFVRIGSHTQQLSDLLGLSLQKKQVISFVGAGGKTTFLFSLAQELAAQGFRVAVTTTTRIFRPDLSQCRRVVTDGDLLKIEESLTDEGLVTVGIPVENGKLAAPSEEILRYLQRASDFMLIEADGSRCLPIKCPREGEPVLYAGTDAIIAVCGLSCLGKPIGQICHRSNLAMQILSVDENHLLLPQDIAKLLYIPYHNCDVSVVYALNQADHEELRIQANIIANNLLNFGAQRVVVASFLTKQFEFYTMIESNTLKHQMND